MAYALLVAVANDPEADGMGWGMVAFVGAGLFVALPLTVLVWVVGLVVERRRAR